ncbi:hypothetical protein C900_04326 [Fulvivirga imtechensis AK7]|uniref:SSD domain-containing protein n=1 Tax=Fulvivirga imtechensis AK7 TaxID=1237149 RepID=L8K0L9_9BACT|nr:MMPL family transporter [Fulvivirga imtechensis]ELR73474.1 hypothetical protein C900_04326 [Fulvivirga imtechensis AK7]
MHRRLSYIVFVTLFIITIFIGYFIKDLRFNYVFESFFPTDDPELEYYLEFQKTFEPDNNYLLIGLQNSSSVFDSAFLGKVDSLTRMLSKSSHIETIASLTNFKRPVIGPAGFYKIPVIHPSLPERYTADSISIFKNGQLTGALISNDARSTAVIIHHHNLQEKYEVDQFLSHINHSISQFYFPKVHLAGKVHAQRVFIETMQYELVLFLSASVVLVIIFLAIAFRSLWGIIIPLIVVMLSTLWILGIMGLVNKPLDILMVLLPTIMFVVGMSDVVHINTKYIEQLRLGESKIKALTTTVKEVGLATFLTTLTTAVGFATLMTASIHPIREFGLYTAIGVFIAFVVAFSLLPASLLLLPQPKISKKLVHRSAWFGFLSRSFIRIARKRYIVIGISLLLIAVSCYGISKVAINTYLIEDLPEDNPLKEAFTFFDLEFGGSRPFELTVTAQNQSANVFDSAVLQQINMVQKYIEGEIQVGNVISPVTVVKGLNQAVNGGASGAYQLPSSERDWKQINRYLKRFLRGGDLKGIITEDGKTARISGRVGDIGSAISLENTKALQAFIARNTDTTVAKFRVTGTSNLIDKNNEYLARNMFEGLGIAFLVVAAIAGLLFKSLRMILITLIPNVIPLLIVAGIMGIFGITLKLSTSVIFTIAFGIAVDDTIHFTSKLKLELAKGKSLLYALKRTYLSTGKAIIVTSIILSGGFLILILSSFGGTFYTGLLVSLTLIFALIIDLSLLPVLVLLFFRRY